MSKLEGRRVLLVAGASGIGQACIEQYCSEGAEVCFSDINETAGNALEKKLTEAGFKAKFFKSDAGDMDQVRSLVQTALMTMGGIDILHNNAGIAIAKDLFEISESDFDRTMDVNLKSAFVASQAVANHWLKSGQKGAIINMSSVNAVLTIPTILPYNVSKGGINQLTRNMAVRLAPHGIRVNAIGPGTIETEMVRSTVFTSKEATDKILSRTPMKRFGQPSEMATIAVFLASDDSSYVTGQVIYADGGRLGLNYTC